MVSKPRGLGRFAEAMLFSAIVCSLVMAARLPETGLSPAGSFLAQVGAFAAMAALVSAFSGRRGIQLGSELAYRDELTGLHNRRYFMEQLADLLSRYNSNRGPVPALLLLDLDRFKVVNDTLGHPAGDELLISVASRLSEVVPYGGILSRLGGDEFAILALIRNEGEAMALAETILEGLNQPILIQGQDIWPSASIGIALPGPLRVPARELLSMADVALYQAKGRGKGQAFLFQSNARLPSVKRLSMESELRTALKDGQFEMVYQPVVDMKDSRIVGAEALLRWDHPTQGLLAPNSFLALMDETGLSQPLCNWIVTEVCEQAQTWRELFGDELTVSINLSALQFQALEFIPDLTRAMRNTGAGSEVVNFEITESALLANIDGARHNLGELQKLGFKVAIDDFGVGYSSLSYLQTHRMDILKLDQSFVRGEDASGRTSEIVRCVVELAHSLGMSVTAEGVENAEQYQRVLDAGCDQGQGFYFSLPLQADVLTEMLANGHRILPLNSPLRFKGRRRDTGDRPPWRRGFVDRWGA